MHRRSLRPFLAAVMAASLLAAPVSADPPSPTAVAHWNELAVRALAQPPQVQVLHLAMVQGAVYDAANAIVGGHEPYLDGVEPASPTASVDAAVATAAHGVLVGLAPPPPGMTTAALNTAYDNFMLTVPDGPNEDAGVAVGADAAAAMLSARAGDGRFPSGVHAFPVGLDIGQWRPTGSGNDPNAWVADVAPFVIRSAAQFRSDGPLDIASAAYAEEYNEVKALGAKVGSSRTDHQNKLASFYSVNPVAMYNRTFQTIAAAQALAPADEARLFAQINMAGADALISCWDDKRFWAFWRPLTAIHEGDNDGNPATAGDGNWDSLMVAPPYPEHPSGYNCLTGAMMSAARDFFGTDRIAFTMSANATLPPLSYTRFTDVLKDTIDARIYLGFHFRTGEMQGAVMGKQVAHWVDRHAFRPTD